MNCTSCGSEIEPERIQAEAGRLARAANKTLPNPKVLRACKYCPYVDGCKAMRTHIPKCPKNPNRHALNPNRKPRKAKQ